MSFRTVAIAVLAALLLAGCGTQTSPQTPPAGVASTTATLQGPRSQVVKQLVLPSDADLIVSKSYWEVWRVMRTTSSVRSNLEPQLPISRNYDNLPWCKTVTDGPDHTRWLWGSGGYDGLSINVFAENDDPDSDYTRVVITGPDAGTLATECGQ
jgi:hypothetical protein